MRDTPSMNLQMAKISSISFNVYLVCSAYSTVFSTVIKCLDFGFEDSYRRMCIIKFTLIDKQFSCQNKMIETEKNHLQC